MSYPQPDANQYALGGYQFYRLQTPLTSPGDIYQSTQSGHGFAIGPESDVSRVNIAYFDDQALPSFVNTVSISNRRAFVGSIFARNEASYAPANRPGRILLWPSDNYDPSYIPSGFAPASQTLTFISPVLDVIEYFSPQASLAPQRNDKTYKFQGIPNNGASGWIVIPYWGRRSATIRLTSFTVAVAIQMEVRGVDYIVTDSTSAVERVLATAVPIAPGGHEDVYIKASSPATFPAAPAIITANGTFDALAILLQVGPPEPADGPISLEVTVSDSE